MCKGIRKAPTWLFILSVYHYYERYVSSFSFSYDAMLPVGALFASCLQDLIQLLHHDGYVDLCAFGKHLGLFLNKAHSIDIDMIRDNKYIYLYILC